MFASVVTDRLQGGETVDKGLFQLDYSIFIVSESVNNAMEIIKGSLDNISRPASTEQTGNRFCPAAPFELLVLSNDSADFQVDKQLFHVGFKYNKGIFYSLRELFSIKAEWQWRNGTP